MPGTNLTRDEAAQRSGLVDVDSYDVALDLTTGAETFRTTTTVRFRATEDGVGADTWIDLIAASVQSIELNGRTLDPARHYRDGRIALPHLEQHNELTVDATGSYMNTGEGLHRFVDPVDEEVYLYTQFEVPDSRRMFAVFEQPDQKARFAFTITAPKHWQVISNSPTPEPTPVSPEVATWSFEPTPPISSYITALVAGPYAVVRDQVSTRAGEIPLAVFCRRSLREHLDVENILSLTKAGFGFFEAEFDQPYPFAKYDQIFTPEYNMGAMENAGCVTITEAYVFRGKVTDAVVERRALTVLHELAHMWFGNLVTMQWWDDLWLNESFAEWASTVCQAEVTHWTQAWTTFATAEKAWAYRQDQLSSTHPIAADMHDLSAVEVNFDGITYAKGASVLKQLVAYVGREPFRDGLRAYFARHAWGNTALDDLLVELEATSGRELRSWAKDWLQTSGVNTITPELELDGSTITNLTLVQTAEDLPGADLVLRPHRLAIGCYDLKGDRLVRTDRVELDVVGERTEVPVLIGRTRPDLLLINDDDLAYTKIRLDEHSLATALSRFGALEDSLARALVLGAAWDMTRDADLPAGDYVRLVLSALPNETDSNLLRVLLQQVTTAALTFTAPETRSQVLAALATGLRTAAANAAPASDAQLQLVTAFATFAASSEDAETVRALLDGAVTWEGLVVDQDLRWVLLTSLAAAGAAQAEEIDAERRADNTATGRENAARALAARPTAEAKEQAWRSAMVEATLPNSVVRSTALGFGHAHDPELLVPYVQRFHEEIEGVWGSRTHAIAEALARGFYPFAIADESLLTATQTWLDSHPQVSAGLRRTIAENRDSVARALRAQQADRE